MTCPRPSASRSAAPTSRRSPRVSSKFRAFCANRSAVAAAALPGRRAEREMALVHGAMFAAVNAPERRYRPYLIELTAAPTPSQEAAAAMAAATVLTALHPEAASDIKAKLASYLATIPEGDAKAEGLKLGEAVGPKVLQARGNDRAKAEDAYRPQNHTGRELSAAEPTAPPSAR